MPRLFVGLQLPEDISERLGLLAGGIHGARWIAPEDHHVTLRFIGDIDDARALEIEQRLGEVHAGAFSLRLSGIDWFGGRRPHSVFARVEPNEGLLRLHEAVERACVKAGMEPERRRFTPHVTLARCRGASLPEVRSFASSHGLFAAGPFAVDHFTLFSARPSRGGGPYIAERHWPLLRKGEDG